MFWFSNKKTSFSYTLLSRGLINYNIYCNSYISVITMFTVSTFSEITEFSVITVLLRVNPKANKLPHCYYRQ